MAVVEFATHKGYTTADGSRVIAGTEALVKTSAAGRRRQMDARLAALALIVYGRGRVTGEELAAKLGVNLRTIYRDIERLQQFGFPVFAVPGPNGGFAFDYESAANMSSSTDNGFIDLFLRTGIIGHDTGGSTALDTLIEQAGEALAPEDSRGLADVRNRIMFDTQEWYARDRPSADFDTLRRAVLEDHRLKITFVERAGGELLTDTIDPYGLVWKGGSWYVFAYSHKENGFRRVRVHRIIQVTDDGVTFKRPKRFDLQARWHEELERFGTGTTTVVLRIEQTAIAEFENFNWKSDSRVTKYPDHWIAEMNVDKYEWLIPLILSYGGDVTVSEPPELRDRIIRSAQHLLAAQRNSGTARQQGQLPGDVRTRTAIHRQR